VLPLRALDVLQQSARYSQGDGVFRTPKLKPPDNLPLTGNVSLPFEHMPLG